MHKPKDDSYLYNYVLFPIVIYADAELHGAGTIYNIGESDYDKAGG